ncbi:hypothetical protein SSP24_27380 [Streptomyces spinoverrucosus]|uniref:Uncharacterized protein n=1 Tax=Streptomyces spinoverrucosus TaxID=284043 RepID=A0A4Y3VF37_9ACTN|nr:hypothetical protein [Streptomyces spinoverrucosus]GEC05083.1 hypothetical protein SSP24_27380 [Streptomyces spinoverrucosus]GHB71787.1 hypothetical protein GCM10010397_47540 [Streptomyces spinoverrucosus]
MARQKTSPELPAPLRAPVTALRRMPGAGMVTKAAGGALDAVGTVSPRGRRVAVYTGAGILGVAGVVEWPVALTVAGVAWLTQPKPKHEGNGAATTTDGGKTAAAKSSTAGRTTSSRGKSATASRRTTSTSRRTTSSAGKSGAAGGRSTTSSSRRKATTSGG